MISQFESIVKSILSQLSNSDYPVLTSRKFMETWLSLVFDKSIDSMRGLFFRLNHSGENMHMSTFSKACKTRDDQHFARILKQLIDKLKRKNPSKFKMLFPIDSTVITLTSKLFTAQNYSQVKLLTGTNLEQKNVSECVISFGQKNDMYFRDLVMTMIPEDGVGVMDRGFANRELLEEMCTVNTLFIVRIKNNMEVNLETTLEKGYRVVNFCDLETQVEYRLATNVIGMTNEEICDAYRHRWKIEILWKFLKMQLKLDKLITKSVNGVRFQIYAVLIAYLILQLIDTGTFLGNNLLDKLRFIQLEISRRCSFMNWCHEMP